MNIAFYPPFKDQLRLEDHYYRALWYLKPFIEDLGDIHLLHDFGNEAFNEASVGKIPEYLDPHLSGMKGSLSVKFIDISNFEYAEVSYRAADIILVHEVDEEQPGRLPLSDFLQVVASKKCVFIDPDRLRNSGSFYLKLADLFPDKMAAYRQKSEERFGEVLERCSSDIGYIFGTGPNLALAKDHDFSDGVSIACNSMVRNEELMERLKPPIIVVGDPIFHAGASSYAAAFREALIKSLDRYGSFLIIPLRDYHIFATHLPARFKSRIIALPYESDNSPNLELDKDFKVTSTANILTLFLIPLAATLFKRIVIAGCDGRPLDEDNYFWKHDKSTQFNDQMALIRKAHPGFFAIDYQEYYATHCEIVETWLSHAEKLGRQVKNITPSYVPALEKRFTDPLDKGNEIAEIAILDPDALSHFGHYLAFDDKLEQACLDKGIQFSIFGHVDCEEDIVDARPHFVRVFSKHSWTIGNRPGGEPNAEDVDIVLQELTRVLRLRRSRGISRHTLLYMYVGSLPMAKIVHDAISEFENVSAVICLFWLSFVDYRNREYVDKWKSFIQDCELESKISLTLPTARMQSRMKEAFEITLPVAPHPSTTYTDKQVYDFISDAPSKTPSKPIKLKFPGGISQAKGFHLTAEFASILAREHNDKFVCSVRIFQGKNTPKDMLKHIETIKDSNCTTVEGAMNEDEFNHFLSDTDIVVLPYLPPDFADRTSGLLIDALFLAKPIIVWEGTWLADIVHTYGNGYVVNGTDYPSFEKAIFDISSNYEVYVEASIKARANYIKQNNWTSFLDFITNLSLIHNKRKKRSVLTHHFDRFDNASIDETLLIFELLKNQPKDFTMIDVGAHHGSALAPFLRAGWKVFAFEPDPKNREYLVNRFGNEANLLIDNKAVGEAVETNRSFFSSDESTGISGMLAFRDTHEQSATVDVTTVEEVVKQYGLHKVDFLKIDVEGYDFSVLKGVPWDTLEPDVIECEFEDEKTKLLGHSWFNICDYLMEKCYTVYVSEWHPIVRYGIPHDWRCLKKYPCELDNQKGWGNLIAFKQDPGQDKVNLALKKVLKLRKPPLTNSKNTSERKLHAKSGLEVPRIRGSFFKFLHDQKFSKISEQTWSFSGSRNEMNYLLAECLAETNTSGLHFIGELSVKANNAVKIAVSFARSGTRKPYEGVEKKIKLKPNENKLVSLSHTFKTDHETLKVQLSVLETSAPNLILEFQPILISEAPDSLLARTDDSKVNLRKANLLRMDGRFGQSLAMNAALYKKNGLQMYLGNTEILAIKMGVDREALKDAVKRIRG